jgi:branched-subunit amino acid transport protein
MNIWLVMVLIGIITYLTRLSFLAFLGRLEQGSILQRALRFVPPAVFSAIILPEIFAHEGQYNFSPANPRFLAALVAVLVAWRTKNILLTLLAGMAVLFLLQAVL